MGRGTQLRQKTQPVLCHAVICLVDFMTEKAL